MIDVRKNFTNTFPWLHCFQTNHFLSETSGFLSSSQRVHYQPFAFFVCIEGAFSSPHRMAIGLHPTCFQAVRTAFRAHKSTAIARPSLSFCGITGLFSAPDRPSRPFQRAECALSEGRFYCHKCLQNILDTPPRTPSFRGLERHAATPAPPAEGQQRRKSRFASTQTNPFAGHLTFLYTQSVRISLKRSSFVLR